MTQTEPRCPGGGGYPLTGSGCAIHTSPARSGVRVKVHATTGPGARGSGSLGHVSPGSLRGAQDRSSGFPELGRSQGGPTVANTRSLDEGRMGTAGPWRSHKCGPAHHRLGLGPRRAGLRLDRGAVGTVKSPLGLSPGADWELTRGPHGLLPLRRDPGPATLPRVGRLRLSLTPGRTSGPRGQGPGWTNLGSGKPRADARIQNPSGAPPGPKITRTEPGGCG